MTLERGPWHLGELERRWLVDLGGHSRQRTRLIDLFLQFGFEVYDFLSKVMVVPIEVYVLVPQIFPLSLHSLVFLLKSYQPILVGLWFW